MSQICKELQDTLVQCLMKKDFLKGVNIVARGVGGLEHEQKLLTQKGRALCVFHPIPQKLVENVGAFCVEQLSIQLALGTDVYDIGNLLDLTERLAEDLHGQACEVPSWTGTLMLQNKSPWSEAKADKGRRWVQIYFLAL